MADHLPPIKRELTKRGDRLIVRNEKGRLSSTIKLSKLEREYVEQLRSR